MRYLLITIYHPKPELEKEFLQDWKKQFGTSSTLHFNEETGEFLSIAYTENPQKNLTFNDFCLIPPVQEIYILA